jgi:hypothetical protein
VVCATKRGKHIDDCTSFTRKIADFSQGFNEGETDCTANIDRIDGGGGGIKSWCELNTCGEKKGIGRFGIILNLKKS